MDKVIACIDGAAYTASVCDCATWAAQRLGAPLEFLHALDRHPEHAVVTDFSGSIGLGAQEALLEKLGELDEQRSQLAQRHGRELLDAATARARARGLDDVSGTQRHGGFLESVLDVEPQLRLLVLGQHHHTEQSRRLHLDHNVERVVRAVQRPVLVTSATFVSPRRCVIAFDGSETARRMVEMVARSPLLQGLPCELVQAGGPGDTQALDAARSTLQAAGLEATATASPLPVEQALRQALERADLLVMGAYGHSRIRHLIVGSTTTTLLRTSPVPVLVLR